MSGASPRRGFGRAYWAMMALAFACVLAGAVVGFFGPRLFPKPPPANALASPPRPAK